MPLYYAPGEAYQFDWSHEIVVLNGVTTTVKVAHVRASGGQADMERSQILDMMGTLKAVRHAQRL
nr:integrase catalytic region [Rhizobium sp. Q54]